MVIINAADLVYRVTFKRPVKTVDSEGSLILTYEVAFSTWSSIDQKGSYRTTEQNTALIDTKDFYIRYAAERALINKDWIVAYKEQDYTIHELNLLDEEKKFLQIKGKVKHG